MNRRRREARAELVRQYKELEKASDIAERIKTHERSLMDKLNTLFAEEA
jgi:hypothetical protein